MSGVGWTLDFRLWTLELWNFGHWTLDFNPWHRSDSKSVDKVTKIISIFEERDQRPKAMDRYERLVDKLIRESMERGEFDDLAGAGEPIDLNENPFVPPDMRTVNRLMRNAGFAPAWIEERKDIDAAFVEAKAKLVRASEIYSREGDLNKSPEWARAVREFRETVAELNRRIKFYNLKAPAVGFHRRVIDAEEIVGSLER